MPIQVDNFWEAQFIPRGSWRLEGSSFTTSGWRYRPYLVVIKNVLDFWSVATFEARAPKRVKFDKIVLDTVKIGEGYGISRPLFTPIIYDRRIFCIFQIFDMLLRFETRALGMRVGLKIMPKFAYFLIHCKKTGQSWWRYLWEFFHAIPRF